MNWYKIVKTSQYHYMDIAHVSDHFRGKDSKKIKFFIYDYFEGYQEVIEDNFMPHGHYFKPDDYPDESRSAQGRVDFEKKMGSIAIASNLSQKAKEKIIDAILKNNPGINFYVSDSIITKGTGLQVDKYLHELYSENYAMSYKKIKKAQYGYLDIGHTWDKDPHHDVILFIYTENGEYRETYSKSNKTHSMHSDELYDGKKVDRSLNDAQGRIDLNNNTGSIAFGKLDNKRKAKIIDNIMKIHPNVKFYVIDGISNGIEANRYLYKIYAKTKARKKQASGINSYFDIGHDGYDSGFNKHKDNNLKEVVFWYYLNDGSFVEKVSKSNDAHDHISGVIASGRIDIMSEKGSVAMSPDIESNSRKAMIFLNGLMRKYPDIDFYVFPKNTTSRTPVEINQYIYKYMNQGETMIKEAKKKDDDCNIEWKEAFKHAHIWVKNPEEAEDIINEDNEIETLEGNVKVKKNDIVCMGEMNDYWPMDKDRLKTHYTKLSTSKNKGWEEYKPKKKVVDFYICNDKRFEVESKSGTLKGKKGDAVVRSKEDKKDIWIVDKDVFENNYTIL